MRIQDVIAKIDAALQPSIELASVFGLTPPGALLGVISLGNALIAHFGKLDPNADYTQEQINAEADAAIAGIHERDKDFVRDEEGGDDGQD